MSAFAVAVVVNAADDVVIVEPAAVVVATGDVVDAVAEAEIAAAVVSGATGHTSSHSKTN